MIVLQVTGFGNRRGTIWILISLHRVISVPLRLDKDKWFGSIDAFSGTRKLECLCINKYTSIIKHVESTLSGFSLSVVCSWGGLFCYVTEFGYSYRGGLLLMASLCQLWLCSDYLEAESPLFLFLFLLFKSCSSSLLDFDLTRRGRRVISWHPQITWQG